MTLPAQADGSAIAPTLRAADFPWLRPDDLSIPMLPDQAQRVLQTVGDPDVTIAKLAAVVTKDPVLATRVLGMANSALYGAMSPLRSVSDAVVRLGTRTVRNVVVTVSMQSQFKSPEVYGQEGGRFMEHAVGTAYVAHLIAEPEAAQLHAVRAKGVGLDHVGAGAQILAVHVDHEIGVGLVQRLETAIDEDAFAVQHRAHRPVADEHTII